MTSLRAYRLALPCLLVGLAAALPAAAATTHHPHHAAASSGAAPAGTGPVVLTAQPNTALDAQARVLARYDLEQAAHHGDTPLVLIGSARLDTKAHDAALFVQLQSASLCGSAGCSTSVYLRRGEDWIKVLDSVSGPIRVMPQIHGRMHDLMVNADDRWVWNGETYRDTVGAPSMNGLKRSVERHQAKMKAEDRASAPKDTSP